MTAAVHLRLDRRADAVAKARDAALALHPVLGPERLEDLRLVLSELVTNAIVHGQGAVVDVRLTAEGGIVRGEVVDGGEGFEAPPPGGLGDEGGRGLGIVATLTRRWGVEHGSTHVWFELDGGSPLAVSA
jgi:serine/threonine-protein kinase RsbW